LGPPGRGSGGVAGLAGRARRGRRLFQGQQIRLIVGSAPGGGYDAYERFARQYMKQHIPGNPNLIVQNMPGAGSLVAANYIYNVPPRTDTVIGAVNAMRDDPLVYRNG